MNNSHYNPKSVICSYQLFPSLLDVDSIIEKSRESRCKFLYQFVKFLDLLRVNVQLSDGAANIPRSMHQHERATAAVSTANTNPALKKPTLTLAKRQR
jgi:hypothetical protein